MPSTSITSQTVITANVFVDANVIAKWLILHSLASKKKTVREKREFIESHKESKNKHRQKMYYSYIFIENMVCKENKKFNFMYSPLVMTEVLNVLFEQYVYGYLQRNLIPLDELHNTRKEKFDEGTYDEIYLKNKKHFKRIEKYLDVAIENKELFGIAGVFLSEYGLLSQDAHLMAQAVFNKCKYFVTNDGDLLDKFNETIQKNKPYPIAITPNKFSLDCEK